MREISLEKQTLRTEFLRMRREYGRDEAADQKIAAALTASDVWKTAENVFVYLPLAWEVGTQAIIDAANADGKRIAVPVSGENGEMTAVYVTPSTVFRRGKFGILEPENTGEILLPQNASLILVPALAFDRQGTRLGRGGGYYDRWLSGTVGVRIGLCYSCFLMKRLPKEEHDFAVDAVCTQEGLQWIEN